jgi:hypothetical protein
MMGDEAPSSAPTDTANAPMADAQGDEGVDVNAPLESITDQLIQEGDKKEDGDDEMGDENANDSRPILNVARMEMIKLFRDNPQLSNYQFKAIIVRDGNIQESNHVIRQKDGATMQANGHKVNINAKITTEIDWEQTLASVVNKVSFLKDIDIRYDSKLMTKSNYGITLMTAFKLI